MFQNKSLIPLFVTLETILIIIKLLTIRIRSILLYTMILYREISQYVYLQEVKTQLINILMLMALNADTYVHHLQDNL